MELTIEDYNNIAILVENTPTQNLTAASNLIILREKVNFKIKQLKDEQKTVEPVKEDKNIDTSDKQKVG